MTPTAQPFLIGLYLPVIIHQVKVLPPHRRFIFGLMSAWKGTWIRLGFKPETASWVADALVFNKVRPLQVAFAAQEGLHGETMSPPTTLDICLCTLLLNESSAPHPHPPTHTNAVQGRAGRTVRGHHQRRRPPGPPRPQVHPDGHVLPRPAGGGGLGPDCFGGRC